MPEKTWQNLWPAKRGLFIKHFYSYEILLALEKIISEYLPEPDPNADVSEILKEIFDANPNRFPTPLQTYSWTYAIISAFDRSDHGLDFPSVLHLEYVLLQCTSLMEEEVSLFYGPMGQRLRRREGMLHKHRTVERERATIMAAQGILKSRTRQVSRRELARQVIEKMGAAHENGAGPKPYAMTQILRIFQQNIPNEVFTSNL